MIKAVLFDYDGTIVDTNEIILDSWRHLYKTVYGRVCRDDEVTDSFGESLWDAVAERFPGKDVDETVQIYRDFQHKIFYDRLTIYPGMKETLLALKARGLKLGIVTSRVRASTLQGIEKFGLENVFDTIVSCEDTDAHKPSPIPCQIALERLGVKPEDAIMVGDSRLDIQSGHNAGAKGVLVGWTICCPESMRVGNSKAEFVINKSEELCDILDTLA